jgi:hypothetical protein
MNDAPFVSRTPDEQLQLDAANELEKRTGKAAVVPFKQPSALPAVPVMTPNVGALPVPSRPLSEPSISAPSAPSTIPGTTLRSPSPVQPSGSGWQGPKPDTTLSDLFRKRIQADEWKKNNPWGSEQNHPGFLGKLAHAAATAGNVAADIFAPATASLIPGTQLHNALAEHNDIEGLERAQKSESERELQRAEIANQNSEAQARLNPKPKLLPGDENIYTAPTGERYQAYEYPDGSKQWIAEGQAPSGARVGFAGPSASTESFPNRGAVAAPRFAGSSDSASIPSGSFAGGGAVAPGTFAGGSPSNGALPAGGTFGKPVQGSDEEKFVKDYLKSNNLPDTAENRLAATSAYKNGAPIGVDDANQISKQIGNVLKNTGIDAAGYAVSPKSTRAEAQEALKAAQQAASEYRQQKSQEHAASHQDTGMDLETVQYKGKDGQLYYGSYGDAKAAGGTSIRKVQPGDEQKARQTLTQFSRWIDNAQAASDTMGAWDNPKDKELAVRVKNDFFSHINAVPGIVGLDTHYINILQDSADYAKMTPEAQQHMQNMAQVWSDAINLMKAETGGVPRGEHFLKLESAILPQPEKTQEQNRMALKQFEQRIKKDAGEYPRPNDMAGLGGVVPPDAKNIIMKNGQRVGYIDAQGKRVDF